MLNFGRFNMLALMLHFSGSEFDLKDLSDKRINENLNSGERGDHCVLRKMKGVFLRHKV